MFVPKKPEDFTMDCVNCVSWPVCVYATNLVSKLNEVDTTAASLEVHVYCNHFVSKGSVFNPGPATRGETKKEPNRTDLYFYR